MTAFEVRTDLSDYPFLVIADSYGKALALLYAKGYRDTDIISVNRLYAYDSGHILVGGTSDAVDGSGADEKCDYQSLRDEVEAFRGVRGGDVDILVGALMNGDTYLSLEKSKSFSVFYGRVPRCIIVDALRDGEIAGHVPAMRTVEYEKWEGRSKYKATREQPISKYGILVRSFVAWLEKKYVRKTRGCSLISKCLEEMAKAEA